jgi:hypothetical protein
MNIVFPKFRISYFPDDIFVIPQVSWMSVDNPTEEQSKQTAEMCRKAGEIAGSVIQTAMIPIQALLTDDGEIALHIVSDKSTEKRFSTTLQIDDEHAINIFVIEGPCFDLGLVRAKLATVH